jgi:lactate permease
MDFLFSVLPILLLIGLLTKPNGMPSHIALPLVAVLVWGVHLVWFGTDPNLANATVLFGLLEALTPISIIWGAIFLFKTMELSGAMDTIRTWLNGVTGNRVAQVMLVGWAFAFLIEGASGFGTPAALAAPILVGLGFPPLRVALMALVMNSVPVSFGAVGTPTWFGLGSLGLDDQALQQTGYNAALLHALAAAIVPVMALRFVFPWREIRRSIVFVLLSVYACALPQLAIAAVNYEFPALVGGAVGLGLTALLARFGIGLPGPETTQPRPEAPVSARALARAMFPLWGTLLILIVTRIPQLGLKGLLNTAEPVISLPLGSLGELSVSPALVIRLHEIFGVTGPAADWSYRTLYVPALVPFFLISALSFLVFGMNRSAVRRVAVESWERMKLPIVALLGALVMVRLLMAGGDNSMVQIIGNSFAGAVGPHWPWFAGWLGATGSFFSGSATISNLTFGGIQLSVATQLGLPPATILALQSVGAAMGNMVCINNIVAVCSILGVAGQEGAILKRTVVPMIVYGLVATAGALVLLP